VLNRYISQPYPALSMVSVAELVQTGLIRELKAVAVVSD
jgi:hypothetical protein